MKKLTKFRVHYKRETPDGEDARGYCVVQALTPEDAATKVRAEVPRAIVTKTKVDKER